MFGVLRLIGPMPQSVIRCCICTTARICLIRRCLLTLDAEYKPYQRRMDQWLQVAGYRSPT